MKRFSIFLAAAAFAFLAEAPVRAQSPAPCAAPKQEALYLALDAHPAAELSYTIPAGDSFAFVIPTSAGTGYGWSTGKAGDPAVVEPVGAFALDPAGVPGAPGRQIRVYRAVAPGTTTFSLVYSRPWEHVAPAKTVTVTLQVTAHPPGCSPTSW
jgi:predicted secreted protein